MQNDKTLLANLSTEAPKIMCHQVEQNIRNKQNEKNYVQKNKIREGIVFRSSNCNTFKIPQIFNFLSEFRDTGFEKIIIKNCGTTDYNWRDDSDVQLLTQANEIIIGVQQLVIFCTLKKRLNERHNYGTLSK